MRKITLATLLIVVVAAVAAPHPGLAQSGMINGQVTRVDEPAGKITIKHGPMPKFQLDEGHTMVFRAQDPEMLKQVRAGDRIRFEADRVNGQFTVTKIQKAK
jgi:Cu/Ag efflux protein CusF